MCVCVCVCVRVCVFYLIVKSSVLSQPQIRVYVCAGRGELSGSFISLRRPHEYPELPEQPDDQVAAPEREGVGWGSSDSHMLYYEGNVVNVIISSVYHF